MLPFTARPQPLVAGAEERFDLWGPDPLNKSGIKRMNGSATLRPNPTAHPATIEEQRAHWLAEQHLHPKFHS